MPEAPEDVTALGLLLDDISALIAHRLASERQRLGLTLQDVAQTSDISMAMLSKIENGKISPSMRTLARLSLALRLPVYTFLRPLENPPSSSVVRAGEGVQLRLAGGGAQVELLIEPDLAFRPIRPVLVTLDGKTKPPSSPQREGESIVYMLEGRLAYDLDGQVTQLGPGDSLFFDTMTPHGVVDVIEAPAKYLSVAVAKRSDSSA